MPFNLFLHYQEVNQETVLFKISRSWRLGSVVKSGCCSCRGLGILSLEPTPSGSQLPEAPGPGSLRLLQAPTSYKVPDGSTASHLAKSGVQPRFHGSNKLWGDVTSQRSTL